MKEYEVTVTIQSQGETIEVVEYIDAYSEEEAKREAEEKVRDNLLVVASQAVCEDYSED